MNKISILLASYNGERYLSQQIDSIINQTFEDWNLFISDDGSSDSTLNIIDKYIKDNSNIFTLHDSIMHRGAMNRFVWMMENVESEYYMFCDQDDIWLPNKIEICYSKLHKMEGENIGGTPLLVFTDLFVVDESLKIISNSMWEYSRLKRVMYSKYLLAIPYVTGCTMFFNHAAKMNSLKYASKAIMHDSLLALTTSIYGKIAGIPFPLIYYRQHSNNVLGAFKYNKSITYRFINMKNIFTNNYRYYIFVKSINNISLVKFLIIKLKVSFKIRKTVNVL